ncbi:hypothetical protein [Oryzomonas rubra]|uniref:Uncharacterized protein n=1 Tax=Oryzomonas rubra TaxID=2509454 RepID=A0A5A9X7L4_9BACT|nr:hypothetical protein [Oryzomonas rubra]KAA0888784.1 hypothetical protein ET418_15500 [Oryzomonas rubra]
MSITVNLDKSKTIAHEIRRKKRAAEFAPLDIKATIAAEATAAEASRVTIREKYAVLQTNIDAATTVDTLSTIVGSM